MFSLHQLWIPVAFVIMIHFYGNDAVYWSTASKDSLNSVALILRFADHHVSFGAYGYAKFNTAPVRCEKD